MAVRDDLVDAFTESVWQERQRQVEKFGDQAGEEMGLPFVYDDATIIAFDGSAKYWQYKNPERFSEGKGSWDGVLLEEVYEALSETDAEKMEVELIQVAAVACAMYETSVRRREAVAKAESDRAALEMSEYEVERRRLDSLTADALAQKWRAGVAAQGFSEVASRILARDEFIQMNYEPDESGGAEGASDRNLGPFLAEMTRITNAEDDANWRGHDRIVDEVGDDLNPPRLFNDRWSEPFTVSWEMESPLTERLYATLYGSTVT